MRDTIYFLLCFLVGPVILTVVLSGCSRRGVVPSTPFDYKAVALQFATDLTRRDYAAAYTMTSQDYQRTKTVGALQKDFEESCPPNYGPFGPISVQVAMETWRDKQPSDVGLAYVTVGGANAEGVTVIVMSENGKPKIRSVEVGRP